MIPKKYIIVGLAEERNQKKSKNALKVGENIVRTMKLSNGMKITLMCIKTLILNIAMIIRNMRF